MQLWASRDVAKIGAAAVGACEDVVSLLEELGLQDLELRVWGLAFRV